MLAIITASLQIIFLVMKNCFEKDAEERKRKDSLHEQWADAVKSGDINRINDLLNRMRS